MKALVTRPAEDAASLAVSLRERGIEPVIEPMLSIRFAADGAARVAPLLGAAQALLFTSANGARAFASAATRRDLPVYAVGDASAAAAREAGFAAVTSAGGNVSDLGRLLRDRLRPADGPLLHAAARAVAGDLAGELAQAGFVLHRAVLYDAVPARELSAATAGLLAENRIALACFFSPRTASSFIALARAAGLETAGAGIAAFALSPAVAIALGAMRWKSLRSAAVPTEPALLAALDRFLAAEAGTGLDASA